jgi:hypothetical protein
VFIGPAGKTSKQENEVTDSVVCFAHAWINIKGLRANVILLEN